MSDLSGAITLYSIPMNFVVPAIGQSFDMLGGQPKDAIALDVKPAQLKTTPSEAGGSQFFYLKDTKSLSDALEFSMSAGGGGWGAHYGMTASASSLLQTSALTQTIHFRGIAQTSQSLVNPDAALSDDAAKLLAQGTDAFLQRYGTHFVAGYVYGKSCNLSYHLNFSTLDLATKFSSSFSESESALGFSESLQSSITNTLNTSHSSCHFSVEANYRGFKSVSPENMTDLAKVITAYDDAVGDSTAILLVICPWTYLKQVNAAFGLPINEALADLAVLTNKLIFIKQSAQNFINSNSYAGDSQLKAVTNAEKPVQQELDDILSYLQACNTNGTPVTRQAVDQFPVSEPLLDQMNTALERFCLAFSVAATSFLPISIAPAGQLAPQSQAFQVSNNGRLLATLHNDQVKGVWFDRTGSHNICSYGDNFFGFTLDPAGGTLVGWCVSGPQAGAISAPLKIQGSTNARGLDDPNNTAKLYWPLAPEGMSMQVTICPS